MAGSQQLLVLASIFFLTMLIVSFYQSSNEQLTLSLSNEAIITAAGIGQGVIEDAQNRAFDEKTITASVSVADSLTLPASLGPESGEATVFQFDDIDDFDEYAFSDSLDRLGDFDVSVSVRYVNNLLPESTPSVRTFSKRIDVSVFNTYLIDTLRLSYIVSY
ncbi:MAG: hypothetical protein KJ799_17060 [Bacteroidetes bacterium]|nr:hypothetical protein [Bacteroidota bacterium]MBU1681064.1 hypothetical protein [Bacteroidota bacterium]MBU2508408.1 hypothetical protein [Bacteroidota bacterium]